MGAGDDLASGTSTFMAELYRTSRIIDAATPRSLVILDELGRGTSTHDGVAIAMASLNYFIERIGCSVLFVTHFPAVADAVADAVANSDLDTVDLKADEDEKHNPGQSERLQTPNSLISAPTTKAAVNIHMGYIETDEFGNVTDKESAASYSGKRNVTFLYKAVEGAAGSSYGLNVARLVGLDDNLLDLASQKAQWMKNAATNTKAL